MLGSKTLPSQTSLWIATDEIMAGPAIPFYELVEEALDESGFSEEVRELCRRYCSEDTGAPSIDPVVSFQNAARGLHGRYQEQPWVGRTLRRFVEHSQVSGV
jgi:hypothetical protein